MASELVRFNQTTKTFEVSAQAGKVLRSLTGPICVVAICGRARQGKSFLLNQLLAKLGQSPTGGPGAAAAGSFAVGSTVKPCTKGLWLWSRPLQRTLPDGQTCHVLLVDAEGIDSYDQTADYSNHIFSLALLLSSVLVYNQMGSIDESSVDKLASVCEFARLIWGRADAGAAGRAATAATGPPSSGAGSSGGRGGSSEEAARELAPSFVWLLRDFQLQLTEDGRQISERDYMEEVLKELPGGTNSEAVRARNQLRASIKARFPDRECAALVRPMNDEARLARMDGLPASELRPEFRRGLDSLVALLLSRCRPKFLRGRPLTGPALAGLAEAYCQVINSGGVPTITSTWQGVVQSECRRAQDAAMDLYRARLEAARGREVGLEALDAAHSAALEAALETFAKQAVGEAGEQEPFLRRLREAAAAAVAPLRQTKRAEAEARAVELLAAEARRFRASVRGEDSDLAAAEARLHDFLQEYGKEAGLGPDKFMRAAEFLAGNVVPELRRLAQEARARCTAASRRVSELEAKVSEMTHGSAGLRNSVDAASLAQSRLERELAAARTARDAATAGAAAARAAAEAAGREAASLREQLAAARVELAARGEAADVGTARLRSELAAAQSHRLAAEAEAQAAAAARVAAARHLAAREAELAAEAAEVESARRAAEAARAAEAQARRHVESLAAQLAEREATLANLRSERDFMQASLGNQQHQQHTEARQAPPAAAAAPAPAAAGERRAAGGRRVAAAGCRAGTPAAAAVTPGGRKRDRAAAELSDNESDGVDVEMVDAGLSGFARGGAAANAGAMGDDYGDDEEVVEVAEMMGRGDAAARPGRDERATAGTTAAGRAAAAATLAQRPVRQQRAAAEPASGQQQQRGGGATPVAATPAAAAAGGGGGGDVWEGSPFHVEREVLRTTPRGGATAAGATATPTTAAAGTPPAVAVAAAGGGGDVWEGSPFRVEREVLRTTPRGSAAARQGPGAQAAATTAPTAPSGTPTAAAAAAPRPALPPNLESMKIDELKNWLTWNGWGDEVLDRSRGRPTKKEWADMVRSKCAAGGGGGGGGGGLTSPPTGGRGQARR